MSHLLYTVLPMAVLATVAFYYWATIRKRLGAAEAQHANARAGEVAARTGLTVVEGDPSTNFMYARTLKTDMTTGAMPETKVRLEGAPDGRHSEVVYYERTDVDTGLVETRFTTYIDANVSVAVNAPFPAFEILMRDYGYFRNEVRPKLAAQPCPFGDPTVDGKLLLRAADPRVGPVLADAIRGIADFGFVHVVGAEGRITYHCTKSTVGFLGQADRIQHALHRMASALEHAGQAKLRV